MSCVSTAEDTNWNTKGLVKGANGMSINNVYVSMAEDLVANCNECVYEYEDDYGKTWISGYCPFYDPYTETCRIGDPSTWDI